jgi:DNA-binding NtrC family response regulator
MPEDPREPESPAAQLERRAAELRILQRVSSEINASLSLTEIYRVALNTMAELFAFHHSLILLLDSKGEYLTVVASRGYEGQAVGGRVPVGTGVIGMVAKKRRAMLWNQVGRQRAYVAAQRRAMVDAGLGDTLGDYVSVPGLPNAESQIAIPLLARENLIGVFSVESPEPRGFTEHEKDLVTIVANQMASAIQTARLVVELKEANLTLEGRVHQRTAELERELRVARVARAHARARLAGALLGESPKALALRAGIRAQAASAETLLLVGPAGAGKEAVARAIHDESARREGPFLYVTCSQFASGTKPEATIAGAGTPVRAGGPNAAGGGLTESGRFDLAHGGTLYLEGVADLSRGTQALLAGTLIGIERARAAGEQPFPDARVIASSRHDLWEEARAGRFDLELCRLLTRSHLAVPGLAERLEDVPAIVDHLVDWHSRQLGKGVERVSEASMRRLLAYRWPGNVRELAGIVERAILVSSDPVLEIEEDLLEEGISLGSYRLVERIGSGGMGEVWLGRHRLLARPAAVKIIRRAAIESYGADLDKRFRREAHATAELTSPHTVQLYDFGVTETGTFYYVMELLQGLDLQEMVKRFGPLPAERAIWLLEQACRSLVEAHERGLVHRDIKPANLFVTRLGAEDDFLKILDFGMVKAAPDREASVLTTPGKAQGTPAFMSPELVLGHEVDGRADLYSLGCSAYWMLTGRLVFDATTPTEMLLKHVQAAPTPLSAAGPVPPAFEALVMQCLAKKPDERPPSAAALRAALAGVPCPEPWTQERAAAWWRENGASPSGGRPA